MSHVRELATYPERFRYLVSKLDEYQKIALEELCKKAARCNREPPTGTAASGATGASAAEQRAETRTSDGDAEQRAQPPDVEQRLARIKRALSATSGANDAATEMATSGANAVAEKRAEDVEKRLSRIKRALSVFSEALDDEPESDVHTPPRKMVKLDEKRFTERHPASCKIWATALKTPPLPCARGGIKKHCETHDVEQEHGSASGWALTGPNVRTTLRVVEPSSRKRTSWCEVRLKESKEHERLVRRVAAAVKSGTAVSKTAAQQLKDELVANSCA